MVEEKLERHRLCSRIRGSSSGRYPEEEWDSTEVSAFKKDDFSNS
jgi:hypothetical protein